MWSPQEVRARVREARELLPGTPFSGEKGGKGPGKLVQGIGEVCQEGLPGLVQGSVIFPSSVGLRAQRSALSVWLFPRVLPVAETEHRMGYVERVEAEQAKT